MKSSYLSIMIMKQCLKKIINKEEFERVLKENLDSRYIKFINIKKNTIILRANKKLREKASKDEHFLNDYVYNFLANVIQLFDKSIESKYLEIICDIYVITNDYKIYVKVI